MRRLPIYFLIDVSESMVGDPLQYVEDGIASLIQSLKVNPGALETVHISIIVFAGQAKTIVPLQDIISFYPPKFPIGSGTSLGNGLGHLMFELNSNVMKTTSEKKGDWKPIVFLFTDGVPTDNPKAAILEWQQKWAKKSSLIAVSVGKTTDYSILSTLTDHVLNLKETTSDSFEEFFKWVTASIATSSETVESSNEGVNLAPLPMKDLEQIDLKKEQSVFDLVDDNFVVIAGQCQNTRSNYLMKYEKQLAPSNFTGISIKKYKLKGAHKVGATYQELSDDSSNSLTVNTEELIGAPTCPCCGNQIAFAVCQCNQIHCIGDEEVSTCPNCGNQGTYGSGSGGFDVNRTRG